MTRTLILFLLSACSPAAAEEFDLHWRLPESSTELWKPQPHWLSNPSDSAAVAADGQAVRFAVPEGGRGMKWSMAVEGVSLEETPWLVVRYRAENLHAFDSDYLVYLDVDSSEPGQLSPLRLSDAAIGQPMRTVAVDVSTLTAATTVRALAVQVQAMPKGNAVLWIERIEFVDAPSPEAERLSRNAAPPAGPDWIAPLGDGRWTGQPDWLGNPAEPDRFEADVKAAGTRFAVTAPGCGMKWSWPLAQPIALEGHRYLAVRYRARGLAQYGDYALCVIGKPRDPKGPEYPTVFAGTELSSDGRWHTQAVDIRRLAAGLPEAATLAVQVQAAESGAQLEIADLRLVNEVPTAPISDAVDCQTGARFDEFAPVSLPPSTGSTAAWRRRLRLSDWFAPGENTIGGVSFLLPRDESGLAATPLRGKTELSIPVGANTGELFLVLLTTFTGEEEPAYGFGRLRAIRDVDRFRVRLEYADGSADECLPMNVVTGEFGLNEGVQLVVVPAEPSKRLERIVLCDLACQGAVAVAAIARSTIQERRFPAALDERPLLRHVPASPADSATPASEPGLVLGQSLAAWQAGEGPPALRRLVHRATGRDLLVEPCPLVRLRVDGKAVSPKSLEVVTAPEGADAALRWFSVAVAEGLRLGVGLQPDAGGGIAMRAEVRNLGEATHLVALAAPEIGPYQLGGEPDDAWYFFPRCGAAFDWRPCRYQHRYSGHGCPLQFVDTFQPDAGWGLSVRTADVECVPKDYVLRKDGSRLTIAVEFPERTLQPGQSLPTTPVILEGTDGHWRRGLEAYAAWRQTWFRPRTPRKAWFREIFNFRQRFLWSLDPMLDPATGAYHLDDALVEARREFGGMDYLHIFDWGNCSGLGRIYGRTGDHSPYDTLPGGREALRQALAGVQAQGVPVGLYIEGYLLDERGKLGRQHGKEWQLIDGAGKGLYWPKSTEMFVCPGVEAWREVQASTYAAKVRELEVDGMYVDQFGFANPGKACFSPDHGHPVPSDPVRTERGCLERIRDRVEAVRPGVAIYTEESPVDVTAQDQDGSFSYAMSTSQRTQTQVPVNAMRFAVPCFKTIEILQCDKPTGSWATGVKWIFFNGEAIWLEGKADAWFEPETRATVRRLYGVLRRHRDAFTTLAPVPLVDTEIGGVYANAFPAPGKTVYTLYNTRHRTVRGPALRLPATHSVHCIDALRDCPIEPIRVGDRFLVSLEIGPHDVGCVVVASP